MTSSKPSTPRSREPSARRRGRPALEPVASEPPPKKRRYHPGGPGGGGRFDAGATDSDTPATVRPATTSRPRVSTTQSATNGLVATPAYPTRERSTRSRNPISHPEPEDMRYSSAAAAVAAVVQSEGYKPREERGWEEFHPNLDIDGTFMVLGAEDVDGTAKSIPGTPVGAAQGTPLNGSSTPSQPMNPASTGSTPIPQASSASTPLGLGGLATPTRRRLPRPTREVVSFYTLRPEIAATPKTPKVLPIHNQTPKEKLDLKLPSYRKTDRILLFESKTFGQARYVEKSMMNVGYQESDNYIQESTLIKSFDGNAEEEHEQAPLSKSDVDSGQHVVRPIDRVEYDMDEQDDMWLENINARRKEQDLEPITREILEITITKIEKEWHALEKRIPKPNPKPPQTHRPRSSSAAAVNGEPQAGEEQDSKCAICDDGDCENTNAIVFCDGCDLAVHQECYGVPFIPEGQWLCRKCQLIGRGVPTCIFCPNNDGAFKQTNSSKWAHLLCAMWIPEVSLGNHTFMEPVMDVEKVPRNRWKLSCYICNQRMGACIQCGNKSCYQAFHVTCARRARLFLKMKNSHGALAVLDGSMILKAFCDKHCPPEYTKENGVAQATRAAKKFYKRFMKGRIWVDSQATAHAIAASHRSAVAAHMRDESQIIGGSISANQGDRKGAPGKSVWKLPGGAPVIPQAVYDKVEAALQRFPIRKRKEFVAESCRYWTLKREARRGAALLKRLQLQMESFSSMELTRRNFAAMGPSGKARLSRRIEFAETLLKDLEQLKALSEDILQRELEKRDTAELQQEFVDTCYFPVAKHLAPVVEEALWLDKNVFKEGLSDLQSKMDERFFTTTLTFTQAFCEVMRTGLNTDWKLPSSATGSQPIDASPSKHTFSDPRERRRLGKRILRAVQPLLEDALRIESDVTGKPFPDLQKELEGMLEKGVELIQPSITVSNGSQNVDESEDVIMVGAAGHGEITVAGDGEAAETADNDNASDLAIASTEGSGNIDVDTSNLEKVNGVASPHSPDDEKEAGTLKVEDSPIVNGVGSSQTPPQTNGYVSVPRISHTGPPTPPQSNGSFGKETPDVLTEGGVPWYLRSFEPQGLSIAEEQWAGRDAVRSLSEELTDLDDDELKGLGLDVNGDTIMASPDGAEDEDDDNGGGDTIVSTPAKGRSSKAKKRSRTSGRRR